MKTMKIAVSCLAMLLVAISSMGLQLGNEVDSAAWIQQDLSDSVPGVTFSDAADAVTVQFYDKGDGIPPAIAAGLGADVSVMAGVVVGDYRAVQGLSFRVARTGGTMADVTIALEGTTGAVWNYRVTGQLSQTSGESCVVNAALDPSLWVYGGKSATYSAKWRSLWNRDVANVTAVKLVITHVGFAQENVAVNDFRLVGEGFISDPAMLQLVRKHFDADISNADQLTEAQRALDSDRNGKSDLMQLLDDEDPGLYVKIVGVDAEGRAVLSWTGAEKGTTYRLERTQDLTSMNSFASVPIDSPVAAQAGNMERTDKSSEIGDGPYFYRAVKVKE